MSRRSEREEAFKVLYAREVTGEYQPEENGEFVSQLIEGVEEHHDTLDEQLSEHLDEWRMDRIYPVERVLLRLGLFEILHTETNKAVVINEAVELAKRYGDEGTAAFVNGLLDNFSKSETRESVDS
ncbi:MAG: transcription antitermination factor NusB [bacterium]